MTTPPAEGLQGGYAAGGVGSGAGMTAAQQTEQQLTVLHAALDSAANAIYITDLDGRLEWVNRGFTETTGYTAGELLGQTSTILGSGKQDADFYAQMWATIRAGQVWSGEVVNRRKDGDTYTQDLTITPVRGADGTVVRYVAVGQDVTERKLLEQELRQAQKMEAVGQLASGIAHDFNNILTTIRATTDLLMREVGPSSPLREDLDLIGHALKRGAELTSKLLAFGHRKRLELQPLDLAKVLAEAARMIRRMVPENIEIGVRAGHPSWVRADPAAVEEILMNLATNARDAMPQAGVLTITLGEVTVDEAAAAVHPWLRAGRYAVVAVADTGVGMDAETRRRVFEPFFTTKPEGRGTGLGMAMVYGLMKQHLGFVEVESQVGRGTTIRLCFPESAAGERTAAAAPAAPAAPADREVRGGTETILLVEDDPSLRRAAQRVLENAGYGVLLAGDGVEALEICAVRAAEIALVFTDLVMPRMGGAHLYHEVRRAGAAPRFLFTSGYTDRDVREEEALDPGLPFLNKPWDVDQLLRAVRQVLDHR